MAYDREALEDAFDRAEGAQEVAFRNHQRFARLGNALGQRVSTAQGRAAHVELARLASKLSTNRKEAK
jgi:hypothetical protein